MFKHMYSLMSHYFMAEKWSILHKEWPSIGILYPSKFIAEMIMCKVKSGEQEGQIIKWLGTRKLLNGFSLPSLKHGNSSSFETNAVKTIKIYTYVCAMFTRNSKMENMVWLTVTLHLEYNFLSNSDDFSALCSWFHCLV